MNIHWNFSCFVISQMTYSLEIENRDGKDRFNKNEDE